MGSVIDTPVRAYLETHHTGLPVTAATLYTTWLIAGAGLLAVSSPTHQRAAPDWKQHITDIEHRSVPIPEDVTALLTQLRERLDLLADDAPLAALRIIAALESTITETGAVAAHTPRADAQSWDTIATGLGLTESEARSRLHRYALGY